MKRIVQQKTTLKVENRDLQQIKNNVKHSVLLPSKLRCIISGPSNCGKTSTMLSLLEHPNGLKFEDIYLYSKSLYQPKYIYLEQLLKPVKGLGFFTFDNEEAINTPSEAKRNSVFIFVDVACDKQDVIWEYFSMDRHNNIDCFYLCQTYAKIPKHLIRDNANILILFKQDDLNLRHVYANVFFLLETVFKDNKIDEGRYRFGLDFELKFKGS